MALSKQRLSDRIYNALVAHFGGQMDAVPPAGTQEGNEDLRPSRNLRILADVIADSVVDEIVQNAQVQTTSGAPDGEHVGVVF